jgi:hypothetical protein
VDGLADIIQDDLVPGCKQLNTADSWNDAKFKSNAKVGDRLDNADGGVVEGRISPHQKTDRGAIGGLGGNDFGIPLSSGIMPGRYAGLILRGVTLPIGPSLGISYLYEPIVIMGDQRPAELLAQPDQIVLRGAFVGDQEHVNAVESRYGFSRQMIRIPAANPDH